MAKEPTLSELIESVENAPFPFNKDVLRLLIATAKAVQELWEHQHQVITQAVLGGTPVTANTTRPIGYGSKK